MILSFLTKLLYYEQKKKCKSFSVLIQHRLVFVYKLGLVAPSDRHGRSRVLRAPWGEQHWRNGDKVWLMIPKEIISFERWRRALSHVSVRKVFLIHLKKSRTHDDVVRGQRLTPGLCDSQAFLFIYKKPDPCSFHQARPHTRDIEWPYQRKTHDSRVQKQARGSVKAWKPLRVRVSTLESSRTSSVQCNANIIVRCPLGAMKT